MLFETDRLTLCNPTVHCGPLPLSIGRLDTILRHNFEMSCRHILQLIISLSTISGPLKFCSSTPLIIIVAAAEKSSQCSLPQGEWGEAME